jgi:hypothetical protein
MAQKTFVAGDVLTASDINTYLMGEGGAWTSWTSTWTQTATITHTTNYSKYARHGRMITWNFDLAATSAGTAGATILVTLPVAATSVASIQGQAWFYDSSVPVPYILAIRGSTTSTINFWHDTSNSSPFGVAPGVTIASGDQITGSIVYEAAS